MTAPGDDGTGSPEAEVFSRDREVTMAAFDKALRTAEKSAAAIETLAAQSHDPECAVWYRREAAKTREQAAGVAARAEVLRSRPVSDWPDANTRASTRAHRQVRRGRDWF